MIKFFTDFNKVSVWCIGSLFLMSSCSKSIVGFYATQSPGKLNDGDYYYKKELKLSSDSTFSYAEIYSQKTVPTAGEAIHYPPNDYVGKGIYSLDKKRLTLHFSSKISKIDSISVMESSDDEADKLREGASDTLNLAKGKVNLFIYLEINWYSYADNNIYETGYIKVNEKRFYPSYGRYNRVIFDATHLPLNLNFDFEKLIALDQPPYHGYLSHPSGDFLGLNMGYMNEKLRIDKPGNYKIVIVPSKDNKYDQVFTGKKTLLVKLMHGRVQIDDFTKVKRSSK